MFDWFLCRCFKIDTIISRYLDWDKVNIIHVMNVKKQKQVPKWIKNVGTYYCKTSCFDKIDWKLALDNINLSA